MHFPHESLLRPCRKGGMEPGGRPRFSLVMWFKNEYSRFWRNAPATDRNGPFLAQEFFFSASPVERNESSAGIKEDRRNAISNSACCHHSDYLWRSSPGTGDYSGSSSGPRSTRTAWSTANPPAEQTLDPG